MVLKSVRLRTLTACSLFIFSFFSVKYSYDIIMSDIYFVSATAYLEQNNVPIAISLLEDSLNIMPKYNYNAAQLLGSSYIRIGQFNEASLVFKEQRKIHPYNTNALLNESYCYLALGMPKAARACLETYLSINPDDPKGLNNLSILEKLEKEKSENEIKGGK